MPRTLRRHFGPARLSPELKHRLPQCGDNSVKPRRPRRTNERNRHAHIKSSTIEESSARGIPRSARRGRGWRARPCGLRRPVSRKSRRQRSARRHVLESVGGACTGGERPSSDRADHLIGHGPDRRSCSGACAAVWPPVTAASASPQVGAGVTPSLVGQTTQADGTIQLTYAGHPVYLFTHDTAPGSTGGQGLQGFGGRWDVLTATGQELITGG
jgi:hypothetical protein